MSKNIKSLFGKFFSNPELKLMVAVLVWIAADVSNLKVSSGVQAANLTNINEKVDILAENSGKALREHINDHSIHRYKEVKGSNNNRNVFHN